MDCSVQDLFINNGEHLADGDCICRAKGHKPIA